MNNINNNEFLKSELSNGNTRGYSEDRTINGIDYVYEYAIKQKNNHYITYFFFIEYKNMECVEDYGHEEYQEFDSFEEAIGFLQKNGVDISLMKPLKGSTFI